MSDDLEDALDETKDPSEHVCPECGETFAAAFRLGLHRSQKHGYVSPRRGRKDSHPGRKRENRSESAQSRRHRQVKETIEEYLDFADALRGRGETDPGDLGDVLRRDAERIAVSLSWLAERFNPIGWAIDHLAGRGGVLTIAGGFNGVGRWLVARWRVLVAERETERAEEEALRPEPVEEPEGGSELAAFPPLT